MLKKRLIFTLLYDEGSFILSRNFNLQKVGDINWLRKNYNFSKITFAIDELIVLDISRNKRDINNFCDHLKEISKDCFVPISAGGGISNKEDAKQILRSGADKLVFNSLIYNNSKEFHEIAKLFGKQCIIASVDIKKIKNDYKVYINNGTKEIEFNAQQWLEKLLKFPIGELYINSIDRDGTGQGLNMSLLDLLHNDISFPVILSGGVGHYKHLIDGLSDNRIDAVSTAHLFNFIGDAFKHARNNIIKSKIPIVNWEKFDDSK
tara:strand:+ start:260 stop:1048 length:789 start_codon:yes stop_codon:yes gene_type:complete